MQESQYIDFSKKFKGHWQKELLDFIFEQKMETSIETYEKDKNSLSDNSTPTMLYIKKLLIYYARYNGEFPRHITEDHAMGISCPSIIKLENDYAKFYIENVLNNKNPSDVKRDILSKECTYFNSGVQYKKQFDSFTGYLMYSIDFTINVTSTEIYDIYLMACTNSKNDYDSDYSDSDDEEIIKQLEYIKRNAQTIVEPRFINKIKSYISSSHDSYIETTKKDTDASFITDPLSYIKNILNVKNVNKYYLKK